VSVYHSTQRPGLCVVADFEKLQPGTKAEKRTDAEVMQKDDNTPSAGTKADSEQKAENIFASSNDTKPNVVGLPSLSKVGYVSNENHRKLFEEHLSCSDNMKGGVFVTCDPKTQKIVKLQILSM